MIAKISINEQVFIWSTEPDVENGQGLDDIINGYFHHVSETWAHHQINFKNKGLMVGGKPMKHTDALRKIDGLALIGMTLEEIKCEVDKFKKDLDTFTDLTGHVFELMGLRIKILDVM